MGPRELSKELNKLADTIDASDRISISATVNTLKSVVASIDKPTLAGDLTRFVNNEFDSARTGIDSLIERLKKTSKTLNPQDESKPVIDEAIRSFESIKNTLVKEFGGLSGVSV